MIHHFQKKLDIPGFNACIIPYNNGYIGLSRVCVQHEQRGVYPEATNTIYSFKLNSNFDTVEISHLKDETERPVHRSWTQGIEDPRLLSINQFTSVTCDTNSRWKPEMSVITFDSSENKITNITPLYIDGKQYEAQKNWLYLSSHSDVYDDYLYSSFPFVIAKVNKNTGEGKIIKEISTPEFNFVSHNGAIVKTDYGYLLTVRIKHGYSYHYSLFVKLNDNYDFISISKPFRFTEKKKYMNSDGLYSPGTYEMCMSLHFEKSDLIVCVSVNDSDNFVQKYTIDEIEKIFT